jgi:flagellar basal body-associated protein FliL
MAETEKQDARKGAEDAEPEEGAAPPPAPKSLLRRALPYLVGGVLSAGLGVTAGVVTNPVKGAGPPGEKGAEKPEEPRDSFSEPFEIVLPTLITNLADPGASVSGKFVMRLEMRVSPKLFETKDELVAACTDKSKGKLYARVRDTLVSLFQSKVSTDIKTSHGKELLKLEILEQLSPIVFPDPENGVLTNVYFEEFIVQ